MKMEIWKVSLGLACILIYPISTRAQGAAAAAPANVSLAKPTPSGYDRAWNRLTKWHEDDSNPVVQRVLFTGRYQHDYANLHADQANGDIWNVRRMRLGPKITLFRTWTLHSEIELNPQEHNPLYVRFTDFYVQWKQSEQLVLTLGKHGVPFTVDGATSSKVLLGIDRSNLSNNLWFSDEYIPGVSVSGQAKAWEYRTGVFSAGAANREFGRFSGGAFVLGSVGYNFGKALGAKEVLLMGSYVYQQPSQANTFTRQFRHVTSASFRLETKHGGVRADVTRGTGYLSQSNMWGTMVMPFVNLTRKFQIVARHTLLDSAQANGVRLARYESSIVSGRGDRYNEWYLGANYYFYGHKLKLQSGVQHARMDDARGDGGTYAGTSWLSALRVSW